VHFLKFNISGCSAVGSARAFGTMSKVAKRREGIE